MNDGSQPSDVLAELGDRALAHALDSIDGENGPLVPFVMTLHAGELALQRVWAEELGLSVAQARKIAARELAKGPTALAFEGYYSESDWRTDAMYVQFAEREQGPTFLLIQRFGFDKKKKIKMLEDAIPLRQDGVFPEL
jgi:hypothetical protein